MKRTIPISILFLFVSTGFAQVQIFKNYDFNSGEYSILGTFSESDRSTLRDSLGEFYTDDTAILNQFKNAWEFGQPGKMYACGYHYSIIICKNGMSLESFSINLNCNEIFGKNALYYFDANWLRLFYGKLKKPHKRKKQFTTIQTAKDEFQSIIEDTSLILCFQPDWLDFEGSFRFTHHCQVGIIDCLNQDSIILATVKEKIMQTFPNENFILNTMGGSSNSIEFEIRCNQSLSNQFNLFERNLDCFGKWKPFDLSLLSYWKNKK
jgi:hypothetical protein